jgi:hypothetical protein
MIIQIMTLILKDLISLTIFKDKLMTSKEVLENILKVEDFNEKI